MQGRIKAIPITLTLIAFAVMLWGYVDQAQRQADLSAMVTPDTEEALALIHRLDSGAAIINNSFTLALWISALNGVKSPHTWTAAPPPTFVETDKNVRCVLGWVPNCGVERSRAELEAGFVLIERRFPYYNIRAPSVYMSLNKKEPWKNLATLPWLHVIYDNGTTIVYRISLPEQNLPFQTEPGLNPTYLANPNPTAAHRIRTTSESSQPPRRQLPIRP